jgi:hypothetical protein
MKEVQLHQEQQLHLPEGHPPHDQKNLPYARAADQRKVNQKVNQNLLLHPPQVRNQPGGGKKANKQEYSHELSVPYQ